DIHTEALVEKALRRVLFSVTGIVVAHRASTVMLADRVALLQNGTITHVGSHAELLSEVPEYRYLLAADDELDDGAERECAWEEDDERRARGVNGQDELVARRMDGDEHGVRLDREIMERRL
ncbi:MAG: ABC transporter ATP-binding protein, partial [Actinomycetia bacterium]|nr:ABC transporter ATP-binding protein [Actinomycetes bacterium]